MDVFVYGTLTDSETAHTLLETVEYHGPARLDGLHRVDGTYPTLVPGGSETGRILRTSEIDALDRYEGVDQGLYVRVSIPTARGGSVETYIGNPSRLGLDDPWPGDGSFESRVRSYLTKHSIDLRKLDDTG